MFRPQNLLVGMNKFLESLDITFRRDPNNFRPRINKLHSVKVWSKFILCFFVTASVFRSGTDLSLLMAWCCSCWGRSLLVSCLVDGMLLQTRPCSCRALHQISSGIHAPVWCPRLYSQLNSVWYYSVATGLWQWSAVSRIFDAVWYAATIVANFYKVQYKHIRLRCGVLCTCVCFKFPEVCFCQELAKLDDIWLSYDWYPLNTTLNFSPNNTGFPAIQSHHPCHHLTILPAPVRNMKAIEGHTDEV